MDKDYAEELFLDWKLQGFVWEDISSSMINLFLELKGSNKN